MGETSSEGSSVRSDGSSGSESSGSRSGSSSETSSSSDASPSGESVADVRRADQIFARNSSVTGTMGYARLVSACKSSIDYTVRKRVVLIGRMGFGADCPIRSDSRLVSRHHARLFWDPDMDQWAIECLSRKNGLLVDGTPLVVGAPPLHLRSKNLVEMGDASFFFLQASLPSVRTGDIARTESLVLDMRNARKKKRTPQSHSYSKKRSHGAPFSQQSKSSSLLKSKKHRSSAADVETDDSSEDEVEHSDEAPKRDENQQKRRVQKSGKSTDRSSDVSPDRNETSSFQNNETQLPSLPAKRKKEPKSAIPSKKRKKSASQNSPNESADAQTILPHYRDEWNKKEKTDFGRALFAVDVDVVKDDDGEIIGYDWERFRMIAELPKKSDEHLADYYRRMIHDVESLLEEEEREKRTKGPRTKHKPGCDCVVCKNTRKSRRKKREENNQEDPEKSVAAAEQEDEVAVKNTGRVGDRLVGLVTAQKLRVRMGLHEALRQLDSDAGVAIFDKLRSQNNSNNDLPHWWVPGFHDRALLVGARKHGVGMWQELWKDEDIEEFASVRAEEGEEISWPTQQAAMKRLREVGSSINAEIRRLNKKQAKRAAEIAEKGEDYKYCKTKGRSSGDNSKYKGKSKRKVDRLKNSESSKHKKNKELASKNASAYMYDGDGGTDGRARSDASGSKASSHGESDFEANKEDGDLDERSHLLLNDLDDDDDDDEMEIEVEEEEDVVVEEEYDDDDTAALVSAFRSNNTMQGLTPPEQIDDIGEGIGGETSSESGSE